MTERIAIGTGASGGIGRAVASRLARDGMAVAVHYSGSEDRARRTAADITAEGGRALLVRADVADETQISGLFDRVESEFGGVDVVVNTAGVMSLAPVTEFDLDRFDRIQRTNVRGTFVVSQQAARRVRSAARSSTSPRRS